MEDPDLDEVVKNADPNLFISHNDWQERLWISRINTAGRKMMVSLENEFMTHYTSQVDKVFGRIEELFKGGIPLDQINVKSLIRESVSGLGEKAEELVNYYLPHIWMAGDRYGQDRLKFPNRKAGIAKRAISYENQKILDWMMDRNRIKIKTVTDNDVLNELIETAAEQVRNGYSNSKTRKEWQSRVDNRLQGIPEDVRKTLRDIFDSQGYVYQRIIRTESVNAYARAALLQYKGAGVEYVVWRTVGDSKVCAKCRTYEESGKQFSVQELLNLDYPLSHYSHPQCRCSFEPIINWEPYKKWLNLVEQPEAREVKDINSGEYDINDLPVEYDDSVRKLIKSVDLPMNKVKFVPDIAQTDEWLDEEVQRFQDLGYNEVSALQMAKSSQDSMKSKIITWVSGDKLFVSNFASEGNVSILDSIMRQMGSVVWGDLSAEEKHKWIGKFTEKMSETKMNFEDDGIQIFGDVPFVTHEASLSPEDYFIESYTAYLIRPYILKFVDKWAYGLLRDSLFNGREWEQGLR